MCTEINRFPKAFGLGLDESRQANGHVIERDLRRSFVILGGRSRIDWLLGCF